MRGMRPTFRVSALAFSALLPLAAAGCGSTSQPAPPMDTTPRVTMVPFGKMPDGQVINVVTLRNQRGVEVRAMSYGGIILSGLRNLVGL